MQRMRELCGNACRDVLRKFQEAVACGAVDLGRGRLVTLQHSLSSFPREGIQVVGQAVVELFQGAKLRRMQSMLADGMGVDGVSHPREVFLGTAGGNFFLKAVPGVDMVIVMVTAPGASAGQGWLNLRAAVREIASAAARPKQTSPAEEKMGELLAADALGKRDLTPSPRPSRRDVDALLSGSGRVRAVGPRKPKSPTGKYTFKPRNRTQAIPMGNVYDEVEALAQTGGLEKPPPPRDDDPSDRMMNLLEKEQRHATGELPKRPSGSRTGRHVLTKTGQLLKAARLAAGFSVKEIANRLRINKGDWERWERGQRAVPANAKGQIIRLMPHAAEFL